MTIAQLTKTRPEPRLTCTWVPVKGADGRTRMEMRWVDTHARRSTGRQAA